MVHLPGMIQDGTCQKGHSGCRRAEMRHKNDCSYRRYAVSTGVIILNNVRNAIDLASAAWITLSHTIDPVYRVDVVVALFDTKIE